MTPADRQATMALDEEVDHVRGAPAGDVESGLASGEVRGTPTLFIDGVVHLGGYNAASLTRALAP
jgi:hypothetical protein